MANDLRHIVVAWVNFDGILFELLSVDNKELAALFVDKVFLWLKCNVERYIIGEWVSRIRHSVFSACKKSVKLSSKFYRPTMFTLVVKNVLFQKHFFVVYFIAT